MPVLSWFIYSTFFDISHRPIVVTGTIQAKEIPVSSKIGGRIAKVLASEGQDVKKGDILVEFEAPELEAKKLQLEASIDRNKAQLQELTNGPRQPEIEKARAVADQAYANWQMLKRGYRAEDISKAEAARGEAQANFDLLKRGYRNEEISQAKAVMDQAKVQLDFQKQDAERYLALSKQGAVSTRDANELKSKQDAAFESYNAAKQAYTKMIAGPREEEIRSAEQRLQTAKANEQMMRRGPRPEEIEAAHDQYLSAKESLILLEQGTRKEEIAQAQAQLKQSQGMLAELEAQLKERQVIAPVDAEVSVMDLHPGAVFNPQQSVATLTKLDEIWTRVYIPERELGRVHVGQEVDLKADAFPNRTFRGKVVQIPSVAEFTPRNVQTAEERSAQVFGLKITIDNKEHLLRGGMNAEINIPPVEQPFERVARKDNVSSDRP
ncbi:MAG TPA: efflux RND transporter periplasmic adaptor subunit [Drouetiella sp.]